MPATRTHTLTRRTLLWLGSGGAIVLLLASAASTWILFRQVESHAGERLGLLAMERARIIEQELGRTVAAHEVARRAFIERWRDDPGEDTPSRFDAIFTTYPDGAIRNRPEISDGSKISTGWIRKGETVTDDLRRRMVLFFNLSQQYGPGMVLREENLFFTAYPEQANMGYDPVLSPNWIFEIPSDFDQTRFE